MALVEKSVLVGYSAAQMFALVDEVERYASFLPWCGGTDVKWRDEQSVVATVHINYHHLKQSFTTENSRQVPRLIEMSLQEGPFSHLSGSWRFVELAEDACKVEFRLQYEFSSKMLEKVIGPVFSYIANSFVEAFVKRAEKLYG